MTRDLRQVSNNSGRQFVVAQLGARMHYAVPSEFHQLGLLRRLLTDLYLPADHWSKVAPKAARYRISKIPRDLVKASNVCGLAARGVRRIGNGVRSATASGVLGHKVLARLVRRELRKGSIDAVYAFDTAAADVFRETETSFCVLEQCVATRSLQADLCAQFTVKGWLSPDKGRDDSLARLKDVETEEYERADKILCPSQFVADSLVRSGACPQKIRVVPYGFTPPAGSGDVKIESKEPVVFFAGEVGFRKGAHAIVEIARSLPGVSFRLAGKVSHEVKHLDFPENVVLLGAVPFAQMCIEFQEASVFFLPSWLEGSATVIYEAMAFGLPVVTTPHSGSVVTNGVEGFLCQPDDYSGMSQRILDIVESASLRESLSVAALETSKSYTVSMYGERLGEAVGLSNAA